MVADARHWTILPPDAVLLCPLYRSGSKRKHSGFRFIVSCIEGYSLWELHDKECYVGVKVSDEISTSVLMSFSFTWAILEIQKAVPLKC